MRPVTPLAVLVGELAALGREQPSPRLTRALALASGLEDYLSAMTTAESERLAAVAERTARHVWAHSPDAVATLEPEMLSGHVEGQLLKFLVAVSGARRVLEIGTFTGYSALAMAEALPAGGHVITCEADPRAAEFARAAFDGCDRITLAPGPALETLDRLARQGAMFDFAFIDADKTQYWAYLDTAYRRGLLAPGAVVVVDNTLYQGEVYLDARHRSAQGAAIAEFNARVAAHPSFEQVLLPLRDGVTLIRVP
ncbi:putative O-methyltransferase YrrM [Saccharothrix coeruleofusca]|uniref:O-methyltransferase n=1 Tax=Saccharothrix coeruleofusca TaxID=33919 RepID=UPI001AE92FA9|nr:class I SAM-dependent methyltransferase [Saccharothrix coeruleofusca]MBP2336242.1 putative O-methyltransferase YrrM [Saccharothrix coeruleofusca]